MRHVQRIALKRVGTQGPTLSAFVVNFFSLKFFLRFLIGHWSPARARPSILSQVMVNRQLFKLRMGVPISLTFTLADAFSFVLIAIFHSSFFFL